MTEYECSRCGDRFDDTDPLFNERKKRHIEGRHTEHGMRNLDIGVVTWVRVWT